MFDDPKKELQRIQQELLSEEFIEEEFAEEILDEDEDAFELNYLPRHNSAAAFNIALYSDEEFDESRALPAEPKGRRTKNAKQKPAEKKKRKKRGVGSVLLLTILSILVIAFLLRWWAAWLT